MSAIDVLARLTPQMRAVLAKQNELATDPFATNVDLAQMRANYVTERLFWNEGGPIMAETTDTVVPSPYGDIPIRFHRPGPGPRPCILYIHGGGFVVGNVQTHDRIMRMIAHSTGAVVVGIDYSLAPEAKYPQAIHECATVAERLAVDADAWGLSGSFSFAGDSGGATLSLATTVYLRDEQRGPAIDCLLLYYGMFGLRDSGSQRLFGGEWDGLTRADIDYYIAAYLGDPADIASPYVDLLSADLHGVPPSYLVAAGLDPLRDDSVTLAAILDDVGVPNTLRTFDGVLHAFLHHSRMLPEAVVAIEEGAAFHRATLGAPTEDGADSAGSTEPASQLADPPPAP